MELSSFVFTLKTIMQGSEPILYVVHDDDDEWQFLSGEESQLQDLMIITLSQLLIRDSTIKFVLDLPLGYEASRVDPISKWVKVKINQ